MRFLNGVRCRNGMVNKMIPYIGITGFMERNDIERMVSFRLENDQVQLMAGVLVFTLVTINVGQNIQHSTAMANAADSAALYLGSQLATKSRILYEQLGNRTKRCKRGKFWRAIFRISTKGAISALAGTISMGFPAGTVIGAIVGTAAAYYQETVKGRMEAEALRAALPSGRSMGSRPISRTTSDSAEPASLFFRVQVSQM